MMTLQVLTTLASPFGINKLLRYIEDGGENAEVKPWVWILWLLVAPIMGSIAIQWHNFLAVCISFLLPKLATNRSQTRMIVRTEAIFTQLIFNHALCVRIKAETAEDAKHIGDSVTDPIANASVLDANPLGSAMSLDHSVEGSDYVLEQPPNCAPEGVSPLDTDAEASPAKSKTSDNLVGKITNLCSSDLANIVGARDFLLLGK